MTPPDDQARATVLVEVDPATAFRIFTEEIDQWWRRGLKFRMSGKHRGIMHIEPRVGGRLFETFSTGRGREKVFDTGRVSAWDPPRRLVLEWQPVNFAPTELTHVEVLFEPSASGTVVTVTHSGWSKIRPDHPARHGDGVPLFLRRLGSWWGDLLISLRHHASRDV